jgi:hypothetical protein
MVTSRIEQIVSAQFDCRAVLIAFSSESFETRLNERIDRLRPTGNGVKTLEMEAS